MPLGLAAALLAVSAYLGLIALVLEGEPLIACCLAVASLCTATQAHRLWRGA
jgi:hypothetical protein